MVGYIPHILYETLCRGAVSASYVHEMTFEPMCVCLCGRTCVVKNFARVLHDAICLAL